MAGALMTPDSLTVSRRILLALVLGGALGLCLGAVPPSPTPSSETFPGTIRPILEAHCFKCHGPMKHKGDVDFTTIHDDRALFQARKIWRKTINQLESLAMPPADAKPLPPDQRAKLLEWLRQTVARTDGGLARDPGPTLIRRLSPAEYDNTIRDLLGVEFHAADEVGMTDDGADGNGFGNLAAALDVSPALMDKYFAAADKVLDRFFGTELSSNVDGNIQERARMARERLFGLKPGSWRNPATPVKPAPGVPEQEAARKIIAGLLRRAYRHPVQEGEVEALMKLYGHAASRGEPYVNSVRLMVKAVLVSPKFLFRIEQDRAARGSDPVHVSDHDLAVRLSYFLWSSMPDERLMDLADHNKLSAPGSSSAPTRLGGRVIGISPSPRERDHTLEKVFDGDPGTYYEGPGPDGNWVGLDLHAPRQLTQIKYMARPDATDRVVGGKFQASQTADFGSGVVDLFTVSARPVEAQVSQDLHVPDKFRYVRYLSPKGSYGNIAEMEVWGITEGSVLEQEVARMVDDPRARALSDNFGAPWLQIRKLPSARPSTEFFPEFQPDIRQAMYEETWTFFDRLRQEDRSVLELLDADYTYVNEDLAAYYKIPDVKGKEVRRISLKPEYHRGGLLGMGSVLSLTSATARTSPTLRGKWILEVIFGTPPPPPPADAGRFKDEGTKTEPKTFREKLAMHAGQAACASCHRKMDPLGFALENYDAVGVWRDNAKGQPLDTSGVLPTGEKFNGISELKRLILNRQDEFLRNLTEQMLTYALGRELDYYDDSTVQDIRAALARDRGRFSSLVMGIVKSYPFQYRRTTDAVVP